MAPKSDILARQLKELCKLAKLRWAVLLAHTSAGWVFGPHQGVTRSRQSILVQMIGEPGVAAWLAGTLSSRRTRSRATGLLAVDLDCARLYVIPNLEARCALLAGADDLEKNAEGFLRIFTTNLRLVDLQEWNGLEGTLEPPIPGLAMDDLVEPELEYTDNPEDMLDNALAALAGSAPGDWALLSVRAGDAFRVESLSRGPVSLRGQELSLRENPVLAELVERRTGLILDDPASLSGFAAHPEYAGARAWMGLPVVIGKRVIGHLEFVSKHPEVFDAQDLHRLTYQAGRLAYVVENAIVYAEAARYLQQFALLNELASAAALGADAQEVSRRVLERLRRIFHTEKAHVLLLSPDETHLQEYGLEGGVQLVLHEESGYAAGVIKGGLPLRIAGIEGQAISHLAVPLKYRGKVIGLLALEGYGPSTFSAQDEQLLVLIASHLAGLFENMRLNEETRQRTRQLQDTVRQLQAVRETALDIASDLDLDAVLRRVVHRACALVEAQGGELGLIDEEQNVVKIHAFEAPWPATPEDTVPIMAGLAGRVAAFGEPLVVPDYPHWNGRLHPERPAAFRSALGVPLKYQDQVIGALVLMDNRPDWVFTDEHIQLLQLLAPQVTVWIRSARLYQELQARIQAQKTAENRLIRSARLAAVGELAAGVAHELNNPLTTVSGFVELVLEDLPPDVAYRQDLELVLKESLRARGVVRRLLDFSRPAENQRISTDLNELVRDALALINHLAHTGGVEICLELAPSLPWIQVDPAQIKQVLLNLAHNAIQSMPTGGSMTVRTAEVDRDGRLALCISVSDKGMGITPENLERIFEPFFTTRPAGSGTGLGLSVSYGIITEHGGVIEVDSQPGQGSTFSVFLPLQREAADA